MNTDAVPARTHVIACAHTHTHAQTLTHTQHTHETARPHARTHAHRRGTHAHTRARTPARARTHAAHTRAPTRKCTLTRTQPDRARRNHSPGRAHVVLIAWALALWLQSHYMVGTLWCRIVNKSLGEQQIVRREHIASGRRAVRKKHPRPMWEQQHASVSGVGEGVAGRRERERERERE